MEKLWAKYPFTKRALSYIVSKEVELSSLKNDREIVESALREIEMAVTRNSRRVREEIVFDPYRNILSFYLVLVLLRTLSNSILNSRFAVYEAKKYSKMLQLEPLESVFRLAEEEFSIKVSEEEVHGAVFYFIGFTDYLRYGAKLGGPWSLINQIVKEGRVLITRNQLIRILQEAIKVRILKMLEKPISDKSIIEELFKEEIDFVISLCKEYSLLQEAYELPEEIRGRDFPLYPPCMLKIIEDIEKGVNVPHAARFAITAFLLNIGKSVDEVVSLFSRAPDFDERKTRYQVEHIAGLRGSGVKYTTFKCENIKILGFCNPNKLCTKIKHPLQYYRLALRLMKYGEKKQ
ncbi:MAG: hypothetical protein DRJ52_04770 [Thermoprotei archaeon]|nr:MAG: hypothetical protein DRJ52_04770 [Thermoprotei archaeon]